MVMCPNCGIEVIARAGIGEGTRRGRELKKVNENKKNILRILKRCRVALTITAIQKLLYNNGIKKINRKKVPIPWNYHSVQAEVSILVGARMIKMDKAAEYFDEDAQEFRTSKVPRYSINNTMRVEMELE